MRPPRASPQAKLGATNVIVFMPQTTQPRRRPAAAQRPTILAGSGILGASLVRGGGAVGETLFGLTSVLPTKVTPSAMASLAERISPNNSVFALMSIFSLAVMLPLILPRTTTLVALMLPLMTAPSPRFKVPSVWISPSSLPSKVNSPANFRLPLISTSEFKTFFDALAVVLIFSPSVFVFKVQRRSYSNIDTASKDLFEGGWRGNGLLEQRARCVQWCAIAQDQCAG